MPLKIQCLIFSYWLHWILQFTPCSTEDTLAIEILEFNHDQEFKKKTNSWLQYRIETKTNWVVYWTSGIHR